MKQIFVVFFICIISTSIFCIDGSFINDNRVNIRDFPSLSKSKVITQAQKGQKVIVNAKISENESINGIINNWYLVGIVGTQTSGWVFGQYLVVDTEDNVEIISIMRLYRNEYGLQLIRNLFKGNLNDQYSIDLLKNYELIESRKTTFWQMNESGFNLLNRYKTNFGELSIFYNQTNRKWRFRQLVIENSNISDHFKIGITIGELESLIGKDYTHEGNKIVYFQDNFWDSYVYEAVEESGKVIKFYLSKYFT